MASQAVGRVALMSIHPVFANAIDDRARRSQAAVSVAGSLPGEIVPLQDVALWLPHEPLSFSWFGLSGHCRNVTGSMQWEGWLEPPGLSGNFDALYPFDPPEAASTGGDQTHWAPVPVRQRLARRVGGQQELVEVSQG